MFPLPGRLDELLGSDADKKEAAILLRIFFTTYGPGVLLLLSGYDKKRDPSSRRQQEEIRRARPMVAKAHEALQARLKEEKVPQKGTN